MKALRLIAFLCGAGGVLLAGAWAGGATAHEGRPGRATDELAYARHNEVGEIPVGDALEVNGQPMQISLFYTSDAPEAVVQFYAQAFAARGVLPVMSGVPGVNHVAGFDPRDGMERFISAVAEPTGMTLVIVGITDPRKPPRFMHGADDAGFPVPPENRAYLGYRSDDAGAQAESGQYVSSLAPAEVVAFYRRELVKRGWTERTADSSPSMVVFGREGALLSVAVQALDAKRGAAVFVNQTTAGPR